MINSTSKQNPFDKHMKKIFNKVYLANVGNRLRELENPNITDCKRWIWELIQNAKDSISGDKNKKGVDIEINIENNIYKFIHNGSPFTMDTLTALLYKYSEGKTNNSESTGRFGTGFLTTHSLSKIVKITSDVIEDEGNTIKGFSVTMFREGEDKELLDGLKKTENSFETFSSPLGWTTYEYNAKTKRNKEAGQLGIQNFKENICLVMLFCPEINSIKLDDNGKIFTIIRDNEIIDNKCNTFQKISFQVKDNNETFKRIFLYYKIEEKNKELSEKFEKDRNLRLSCAIEIDENNNIIINESQPSLFCSLPLVGSENHKLPFYINSPDFEPDSERKALLLDGNENDEKTGKITDVGINKMIFLRVMEIYKYYLDYINKMEIKKRYLLTRGICSIPSIISLDAKWYKKNFIYPMRDILFEYPILWDGNKYKKLTDVYIPRINNYEKSMKRKAYNFISFLYDNKVPSYEESTIIEEWIWEEDERIKFKNIENCAEIVEKCQNINNLCSKLTNNNDIWNWINDFLLFIWDIHNEYLSKYSIIPNMNSEFVKLTTELATSKNVPENMIECLEILNIKWRNNHIHKKINLELSTDHNINYAVSIIKECVNDWSNNVLILMEYIPDDNNNQFKEKREKMFELCSFMWKDVITEKKDGNKFPEEIWDKIDKMVFRKIIKMMEEYEHIVENLQ